MRMNRKVLTQSEMRSVAVIRESKYMNNNRRTTVRQSPFAFRAAFTLIELLVFLGIFAFMSAAFIAVLLTVTRVQVRQASVVEVSEQSQFLLQQIQYYIEKSSLIDIPQDTPTSTLKLWTGVDAQDPTYITLTSGVVYLQQTATGTPQALTSNKVTVSNLTFTRRANAPSHDSVNVSFTLAYNTSNIQQAFSQMLQTSIARVSAATFDSNIIPSSTASYNLGTSALTWSSINQKIYFSGSNVGIGTTANPVDTLELNGNLYIDSTSTKPASTTNRLYNVAGSLYWNGTGVGGAWTTTSTGIYYTGGNVGIGTSAPGAPLDVAGTSTILETAYTPVSTTSTCTVGMQSWDTNYIYICTSSNNWKKAQLQTTKSAYFLIENPNSSEDDAFFIFNATSTITKVEAVNKTQGDTVTFNLFYNANRSIATSSASAVFSSYQTANQTSTIFNSTSFSNSSPGTNAVLRFVTSAGSSTQFLVVVHYYEN